MRDVVRQVRTFPELLRRLDALVEAERGSSLTDATRSELERRVRHAIMVYRGTKFASERAFRSTLHEIMKPLGRVIALLEDDANRDAVLVALGAPEWLAIRGRFSMDPTGKPTSGGDLGEQQAAARHRSLLDDLRAIARAVPKQPEGRKRGRPPTARSFHGFVGRLATCWERASGTHFRQGNRRERFVIDVVEFVDPACLEKLPYMIERVVAERIAQTSGK